MYICIYIAFKTRCKPRRYIGDHVTERRFVFLPPSLRYSLSRYKRRNSYSLVTCFIGANEASRGLEVNVTIITSFLRMRYKCVVTEYRFGLRAMPLTKSITELSR